jgi:hypothetical protein
VTIGSLTRTATGPIIATLRVLSIASYRSACGLAVFQIQLAKKMDVVPLTRDYLYAQGDAEPAFLHAAE